VDLIVWLGSDYVGVRSVHPGRDRRNLEVPHSSIAATPYIFTVGIYGVI